VETSPVGIVTGGVGGIGAACAVALGRLGGRLVLADRSLHGGEALVQRVEEAGGAAILEQLDVRDAEDQERVVRVALDRFGRIDFLLALAGIADQSSVADGDPELWRTVVETNVLGLLYSCRAVAGAMQRQGSGHILIMASVSGRDPYVGEPVYIASKWAQVGFAHSLRLELQPAGIRVTLIEPGLVDTPLTRGNPKVQPLLEAIEPLTAEDVAQAVVYAFSQPPHVAVSEVVVRPQRQQLRQV
jgi:NADP-dependent 3-hydroxy acid dehydrogenase YdfG